MDEEQSMAAFVELTEAVAEFEEAVMPVLLCVWLRRGLVWKERRVLLTCSH